MSLNNLNGWELLMLVLLGLFIFGPDRLPKVIGDGMRLLRKARTMAQNASADLSRELGTEVDLTDLHPKTFLRKHLLSEADEQALRRPLMDAYGDLRGVASSLNDAASSVKGPTLPLATALTSAAKSTVSFNKPDSAEPTPGPVDADQGPSLSKSSAGGAGPSSAPAASGKPVSSGGPVEVGARSGVASSASPGESAGSSGGVATTFPNYDDAT